MTDLWADSDKRRIMDPFEHAVAVTPSDSADLSLVTRGIYIGSPGAVKVDMVGSGTVTFADLDIGFYPLRVSRVYATGTAASSIIALW
jgi:hypothetical protein